MTESTSTTAPIHLDLDTAVAQVGDLPSVLGILGMVEESLQRDIPSITEFLANGNVPDAAKLLHSLKGFVPIFCRAALCEHITQVEALSKRASVAEVQPAFEALKPELEQLLVEVSACLKAGNANT
jgi:HPt (histidine-containing phosphotransfer) domain-containing protein